jgi:DNA-binding YbaB/EbfC family protein
MSKNPFGNMASLMKQAQAMQEQMTKIQEEAASKQVTGTAGGGIVTVTVTGGMQVVSVKIDPEVVKSGDVDMLQDLTAAATNEALRNAREMMANELKSLTGGMNIPGLF